MHFDSHCFTDLSSPTDIQVGLQKPSILMLHPNTCNLGRDSRFKIPELDKPQLSTFFKPFQTLFFLFLIIMAISTQQSVAKIKLDWKILNQNQQH